MWTRILQREPVYCPWTLHLLLDPSPSWQAIKLFSELHNRRLPGHCQEWGWESVWSVALELRRAPGTGRKGPGGGLGSAPRLAFSTSEDIDGCVYQVMASLRAEAYFLIHSFIHTFTRYGVPLGARQCAR